MPGIEVVIVGGGVIGWACGRALATRGTGVAIVDPGPVPGAATPASAGMLAAQTEAHDERKPGVLALCVRARETTLRTARSLTDTTGIDVGLLQRGIAQLALDETEERTLRAAVAHQRQLGLRAEWLDATEVHSAWPATAPARGAAFVPEDGALDPTALAAGLRADAERVGVRHIPQRARALEVADTQVRGVRTEAGLQEADAVVLAAGAWSSELRLLPRPLPVEPMRGQMIALPWPERMQPAILYGHGGYLLPRRSEALVGATMESVGFDHTTTPDAQAWLRAIARAVIPSLGLAPVARHWAGLRPMTPDGLPLIGPDPQLDGLWYATGHGRNGILLAVLTGEIIADLLHTGQAPVDAGAFRPDRFHRSGSRHNQPNG